MPLCLGFHVACFLLDALDLLFVVLRVHAVGIRWVNSIRTDILSSHNVSYSFLNHPRSPVQEIPSLQCFTSGALAGFSYCFSLVFCLFVLLGGNFNIFFLRHLLKC